MSIRPLSDDERAQILRRDIIPLLFPDARPTANPTLTLLTGPPGGGQSRAGARLRAEHIQAVTTLSANELRAFHPGFAELRASASAEAAQELGAVTAEWLRAGIAFARQKHRSLLIQGSFATPSVAIATAQRFAAEGFGTRIVITGVRRAESLLSTVSAYLRGVQARDAAQFVSRDAHDRGLDGTRALAAALEESDPVDRVTILGRDGADVFDAERGHSKQPFSGARAALMSTQSGRLTSLQSTQWLSELRRVTEFAATFRDAPRPLTEVLVDLHEIALREIIPELPVPAGSMVVATQERRSASDLVMLRRSLVEQRSVDAAAPSLVPGAPERDGLSR